MNDLIILNKPYGVIASFLHMKNISALRILSRNRDFIRPAVWIRTARVLLLLTNNGRFAGADCRPKFKQIKTYWAQVEGSPDEAKLDLLRRGVDLGDLSPVRPRSGYWKRAKWMFLWPRVPPIRVRKSVPDFWVEIKISEGKNRQVRG